jgi:glycogen debranching enzyme
VRGADGANLTNVKRLLSQFEEHLKEAGIGQVSEILDGDPPFQPRGCIAQAWSVAELLRVALVVAEAERKTAADVDAFALGQASLHPQSTRAASRP